MIKTNDLLMVRLQWPSPDADLDAKGIKHHKKILAAARRCLFEHAPVEFAETGFQLLLKTRESEMVECLDAVLDDIGIESAEILVMLSVPEHNEYTEYYYTESFKGVLMELATGVSDIQDKVRTKPPRVDTFNALFKQVEMLTGYVQSDQLKVLHQYLVKLENWDYEEAPTKRKGIVLLGKLSDKIREMEL